MTTPSPWTVLIDALPILLLLIHAANAFDSKAPIVISGCGPASLVFCRSFLRLVNSTKIVVYEKRPHPQRYVETNPTDCIAGDNAFGFGISQKSQEILGKTPGLLEAVESISQPAAFAPGIELRIVNRRELCAELLHELHQEFGNSDRLELNFGMAVTNVNTSAQVVTVVDETTNTTLQQPYALLIAADGANSAVRSRLVEQGQLECQRFYADYTWKALQLPKQPLLSATSTFQRYPKPFYKPHSWLKKDNGAVIPRFQDRFVLLNYRAKPKDDDYTALPQNNPFQASTPQQLKESIRRLFPNVTNFPSDEILETFLQQTPGRESWMKLNRHYVPEGNVVLVGDAANGFYSLFGQGAASAMTSADLLAETLASVMNDSNDVEEALLQYSNTSVVEGHAITDLNLLTHVLRKGGLCKFWALHHMMGIGKTLSEEPNVPYSEILKKKRRVIWISKLFWKRARIPAPTIMSKTR
jgi:2-polyprenyl-6-methoxyphenol hydroxylase-like FAD-dependent oxidoreductase